MFHSHKCGRCGRVWVHSDDCVDDVQAHTCGNCGTREWFKHDLFVELGGVPGGTCERPIIAEMGRPIRRADAVLGRRAEW